MKRRNLKISDVLISGRDSFKHSRRVQGWKYWDVESLPQSTARQNANHPSHDLLGQRKPLEMDCCDEDNASYGSDIGPPKARCDASAPKSTYEAYPADPRNDDISGILNSFDKSLK